jgi:hypothetical protein
MKYSSNHHKNPLESTFFLEWDMGTIRRFCTQEMALNPLAQNEASRALVPELGLKPPYKPRSLASWWDMGIIKIFCVLGMGLGALTMVNEGKQGLYDLN